MKPFVPRRVLFEERALDYELGRNLVSTFRKMGIETSKIASHNRVTGIPGKTASEAYREGKRTLVIGVRKEKEFQTCKPSAHYQLPIVTGCSGMCEYCYLATNLGKKPYIRIYVNIEEVLGITKQLIQERIPETTLFEGSAVSDPVPVERYTGLLGTTIDFFAREEFARFRFVTKFTDIDGLLGIEHNGHTTIRFSINTQKVIEKYEHATPSADERIAAARKVFESGYPLGFLIAPIMYYPGWEEDYEKLIKDVSQTFRDFSPEQKGEISFELISHRYTNRAKTNILEVFPHTDLSMEEGERKYKYGQFGYGKFIYRPDIMQTMQTSLLSCLNQHLPEARVLYFV
ncbi:MAG: spore photoproduct lyase [Peptococcaceae bacterium]|nr:spore photoproduct lyase [Peptococcaceae bacterium]